MQGPEMSITQALNQLQSWLNANEIEKVIQGCKEILEIEPGNIRALALMKLAYEKQGQPVESSMTDASSPLQAETPVQAQETIVAAPAPTPAPAQSPVDPLQNLQVETPVSAPAEAPKPMPSPVFNEPMRSPMQPHENRKLLAALLVPAVLVIGIGGAIVIKVANMQKDDVIQAVITDEAPSHHENYLASNETRLKELKAMQTAIEDFKDKNQAYPGKSQVVSILEAAKVNAQDPEHGDLDKAGKVFAYLYRVYDTAEGPNTAYALTAIFENSQGFGTVWGLGNALDSKEDPRDLNEAVTLGAPIEKAATTPNTDRPNGPQVKPQQ